MEESTSRNYSKVNSSFVGVCMQEGEKRAGN